MGPSASWRNSVATENAERSGDWNSVTSVPTSRLFTLLMRSAVRFASSKSLWARADFKTKLTWWTNSSQFIGFTRNYVAPKSNARSTD